MEVRNAEVRSSVCGNRGHVKHKCWQIIGYPSWHPRSKKNPQKKLVVNRQGQNNQGFGARVKGTGSRNANQVEVADNTPSLTPQ